MAIQRLYSNYTHASCKAMQDAAMAAISHNMRRTPEGQCSAKEIELLHEIVNQFGSKDIKARVSGGKKG